MFRPPAPIVTALLLICLAMSACGGTMNNNTAMVRQLQSITVTPQSAMAQNFSNKQVQFTAMGHFNMAPMTATPLVMWSLSVPMTMAAPMGVTINSNGMAQCTTFSGTVNVVATAPINPGMPVTQMGTGMTMSGPTVSGMAQLTCP
ncbi:MAG TPA: hypothetical protein VFL42_08220 [Terriglobales bacterium]|jgi:hypothetical protein|nr:hypothetical protein [Terriglobales bacterium]